MTPIEWLLSGDTGMSSRTICAVMTGSQYFDASTPMDADDFGRCYRLLKLFPEWKPRMNEVARVCKAWGPLVAAWDELTALYESMYNDGAGRLRYPLTPRSVSDKFHKRIHELNDEGRLADGWKRIGPGSWERGKQVRVPFGKGCTIEGTL